MKTRHFTAITLLSILLFACFLRFYQLEANPPGLYFDEAFFGNTARSLLPAFRDREGNFLPILFLGHGTGGLPIPVYSVAVSISLFGFNKFAVRFMPALIGVLIVFTTFLLGRLIFNSNIGLLAAFLTTVSPWQITYSRMGFANILPLTFFISFGLYLMLRSLKENKWLMLAGGVSIGLTFLSYLLSYMFIFWFLFAFHYFFYSKIVEKRMKRVYIISLIIILFFSFIIPSQTSDTKITLPASPKEEYPILENIYAIFDGNGWWSWPPYQTGLYAVYPAGLVFLLLGIVMMIKSRDPHNMLLLSWLLLSVIIGSQTSVIQQGSLRRIFTCAGPVVELIIAYGVYRILAFYRKNNRIFWILLLLIAFSLLLGVSQFLNHYFIYQPTSIEAEQVFISHAKEIFAYTESVSSQYDRIVITTNFEVAPENTGIALGDYVLFYTKNPLNKSKYMFGNFSSDKNVYNAQNRNLYVVRDFELANITPKRIFYYSNGEIAYKIVE